MHLRCLRLQPTSLVRLRGPEHSISILCGPLLLFLQAVVAKVGSVLRSSLPWSARADVFSVTRILLQLFGLSWTVRKGERCQLPTNYRRQASQGADGFGAHIDFLYPSAVWILSELTTGSPHSLRTVNFDPEQASSGVREGSCLGLESQGRCVLVSAKATRSAGDCFIFSECVAAFCPGSLHPAPA